MSKPIYLAILDLHSRQPNLIKVWVEETEKMFKLDRSKERVHIIGGDTPRMLYGRQLHKLECHWRYTAQEALELLRELTAEAAQLKRLALREAESNHEYVERFRLMKEEQSNDRT